jgi:hypothetical protein
LAVAFRGEALLQIPSGLNQQVLAYRSREYRNRDSLVGRATGVRIRKEANSSGEQRNLLCRQTGHEAEYDQRKQCFSNSLRERSIS